MGARNEHPVEGKIHRVGITFSRKILPLVEKGWIALNKKG